MLTSPWKAPLYEAQRGRGAGLLPHSRHSESLAPACAPCPAPLVTLLSSHRAVVGASVESGGPQSGPAIQESETVPGSSLWAPGPAASLLERLIRMGLLSLEPTDLWCPLPTDWQLSQAKPQPLPGAGRLFPDTLVWSPESPPPSRAESASPGCPSWLGLAFPARPAAG